jgi:predicted small secreted protein
MFIKRIILMSIFCLSLGACETIGGAGRDIEKAGEALQRSVK